MSRPPLFCFAGVEFGLDESYGSRQDGYHDDGHDDGGEVFLNDGDIAEEIAAEHEAAHPAERAADAPSRQQ